MRPAYYLAISAFSFLLSPFANAAGVTGGGAPADASGGSPGATATADDRSGAALPGAGTETASADDPDVAAAPEADTAAAADASESGTSATEDGQAEDAKVEDGQAEDAKVEDAKVEDGQGADEQGASEESGGEGEEEEAGLLPGEFEAEVALVSDYIFRGITNTDHNPAIQGGITYSVDLGLPVEPYVGFWGSNVDFDDGGEAKVEIDALFGLTGTIAGIDWDLGGQYYAYPGANSDLDYDYWEIPLKLSYALDDNFTLLAQYAYSPDYFAGSGNAHYLSGGVRWEHPLYSTKVAVEASTGHQWIEDNDAYGVKDYQDWRIAVSVTLGKITLGVAYTDTSLSRSECFSGTNQCDPRATFSLGASF